jgi:RNA polymerase sigma factor (sigma-70 family)
MRYELATNEQLWTILRTDIDCPLPLMEGAFYEALDRGLIRQFIKSVLRKRMIKAETKQKLHVHYEDLLQIGYEAAVKALKEYEPSKGTFTNLLFIKIHQAYGMLLKTLKAQKRDGDETSYQELMNDDTRTYENLLYCRKMSVEKTVIQKLELEEKLSRCKPIQRETFERFMLGYTLTEIAEQMDTKKSTAGRRLEEALIKMAGYKINLQKLGLFERPKTKGA